MMRSGSLFMMGGLCLGMIVAGFWLLRSIARQDLREQRVAAVQRGTNPDMVETRGNGGGLPVRLVTGLGTLLARSGILPPSTLAELERTLVLAGMRQRNGLALFVGGKLLFLLLLPVLTYLLVERTTVSPPMRLMLIGMGAVAGLLLPDFIIGRRRATYLNAVNRGLPDALDMLVICSEAGLGLEMGLERVAGEIEPAHPAMAAELKLTCGELRILADRRVALTNMGTRTGLETLKRLGATLIQTMQYGTPLSQALRTLSTEMRYETLMRFEAQAARLPVLLTVPMILFILPCIFIVVGGPAGLTVARTFIHH
jgi:tight adherence protein C